MYDEGNNYIDNNNNGLNNTGLGNDGFGESLDNESNTANQNTQNNQNNQNNQNSHVNLNKDNNQQNNSNNTGGLFGNLDPNTQYLIWFISGIIQIINICCCNAISLIFGIITVIFATKAKQGLYKNNKAEFEQNIKTARLITLIGWALTVLNVVLNIVLGLAQIVANAF